MKTMVRSPMCAARTPHTSTNTHATQNSFLLVRNYWNVAQTILLRIIATVRDNKVANIVSFISFFFSIHSYSIYLFCYLCFDLFSSDEAGFFCCCLSFCLYSVDVRSHYPQQLVSYFWVCTKWISHWQNYSSKSTASQMMKECETTAMRWNSYFRTQCFSEIRLGNSVETLSSDWNSNSVEFFNVSVVVVVLCE